MTNGVGLWIGASESTAVIVRDPAFDDGSRPADIDATATADVMSTEYIVRDTVLYMSDNGTAIGGPGAEDATPVSDFTDRVGDPDGMTLEDGVAYQAEDLYATALFCMLDLASADLAGDTRVIAAYPPEWSYAVRSSVRDSLDYLGLRHVRLQPAKAPHALADGVGAGAATRENTPSDPAHAAALAAVATPDEPPTEEIPIIAAPADEQAYSAVLPVVPVEYAVAVAQASTPVRIAATTSRRTGRTPLLVAASLAAAFAMSGVTVGFALRTDTSSEVPAITQATAAPIAAPIAPPPTGLDPISFPTVEAPAPTDAWTPEPAPAPVVEVASPVPVVETTTPEPTPAIALPTVSPIPTTPETTWPVQPESGQPTTERGLNGNAGFTDPWFTEPGAGRSAGTDTGADTGAARYNPFYPFDSFDDFLGRPGNFGNP